MRIAGNEIIVKIFSSSAVCKERVISEGQHLHWIPVFSLKRRKTIGLVDRGHWGLLVNEDLIILDHLTKFKFAVTALEFKYAQVVKNLTVFEESFHVQEDLVSLFPFVELVKAGLEWETSYWVELALSWCVELDLGQQSLLKNHLAQLTQEKQLTQNVRHKSKKILSRVLKSREAL
jgi:hypothetical protein